MKGGETYSSKRIYLLWSDDKPLIPSKSRGFQIVGDSMEDGHGLIATTELVNDDRRVNK